MLVNKTVEFFLSEVAGWGEMPTGAEAGLAAEPPEIGVGGGKITGAGSGLGARCRRGSRLGWQRNL